MPVDDRFASGHLLQQVVWKIFQKDADEWWCHFLQKLIISLQKLLITLRKVINNFTKNIILLIQSSTLK